MTPSEAKRFFADKVDQQAAAENIELSATERKMLWFSESDPDFEVDPRLVDELADELSDEEYEAKISGLLERRFAADAADECEAAAWRDARATLEHGDHYISIMIDRAIPEKPKRWWQLW